MSNPRRASKETRREEEGREVGGVFKSEEGTFTTISLPGGVSILFRTAPSIQWLLHDALFLNHSSTMQGSSQPSQGVLR
jgi:hypothetical protein